MNTENKKNYVIPTVVAVVIILVAIVIYGSTKKTDPSTPAQNATTTSSQATTTPKAPTTSTVTGGTISAPKPPVTTPVTTVSTSGNSSIELISPDGGNGFAIDASNGNASIPVNVEITNVKGISLYLLDSAGKVVAFFADANDDKATTFQFRVNAFKTVDVLKTGDYKIKVCDLKNSICDTSAKSFTVRSFNSAPATVTVLSPNGGESWKIGSKQQINFKTAGNIEGDYKIALTLEPKAGPIAVVAATSTSYTWTVPKTICWGGDACGNLSAGYYKIKATIINDTGSLVATDESDMSITIIN